MFITHKYDLEVMLAYSINKYNVNVLACFITLYKR